MEGNALVSALTTAFGTTASDCLSAIAAILPIVLPVMGGIVVITIGVRLFKKLAK